MIKPLFLSIVGVLFCLVLSAQDTVLTVRVFKNKQLVEKRSFGIDGNLLQRHTKLSDDPELWFREFRIYDHKKLIRSGSSVNGDPASMTDYTYFYNDRGKLEKKREAKDGLVSGETFYTYNDKGWLINEKSYVGKRKQIEVLYAYDLLGRAILRTETITDSNRVQSMSEQKQYNEIGKVVRVIGLHDKDTVSDIRFTYDQFGIKLQQDVIAAGDTTLSIIWYYGRSGSHPVKEVHMADGFVVRSAKYFYDKHGRKKREETMEYRVFSGHMKPEKSVKKIKYYWQND